MPPSLNGPLTRVSSVLSNTTTMEPKAKSGVAMASAMALHFFGYEFARGSNMALFTSSKFGFANSGSYYPLAMTCVSPISMSLLLVYGRQLDAKGPRKALRNTTCLCISLLSFFGIAVKAIQANYDMFTNTKILSFSISQLVIFTSFIFQNSYAWVCISYVHSSLHTLNHLIHRCANQISFWIHVF